jgi:hypothetical protein
MLLAGADVVPGRKTGGGPLARTAALIARDLPPHARRRKMNTT